MLGFNWGHGKRMNSAIVNNLSHIPSMYSLPKDHKSFISEIGPKARPVCGASEAPNGQLSEILAEVIMAMNNEMDKEIGTMCLSTEELLSEIDNVNERSDMKNIVVLSTDVVNMYPSLPIDLIADIITEEFITSNI